MCIRDRSLPLDAVLAPLLARQTRPIKSKSNLMHCYIAQAEDNPWLANLDTARANVCLAEKRAQFLGEVQTGRYWQLPTRDQERLSPEVRELQWVGLRDAMRFCLSTMAAGTFVNEYQRLAFSKYGKSGRDPMYMTAAILYELEAFPNEQVLRRYSQTIDMELCASETQWLRDGMTSDQVRREFMARTAKGKRRSATRGRMNEVLDEARDRIDRAMLLSPSAKL
eukprot:TRINITY_DN46328_c0_g1_i1.p1 TRINITY_DN46328_c0_g1~~TRINITY_DN46328_c0_g1_i1.p1  ORF type:complete len:224 (-),score=31.91 TRINITY_DN46328_c0_g1_i1:109-780(-)